MNHIRIYHIIYYILFRHQSGRRQSYEFDSAVKRLVRMSRIFFCFSHFRSFPLFSGWGGVGGDRAGDGGADWIGMEVDWRWSGLEKKMKWIGLEWRKRREIGETSLPNSHFFKENTYNTIKKIKKRPFSGKKSPAGIPLQP